MWALIFGGLILGSVLGILYLASRFAKFRLIQKVVRGKKILGFLLGIVPVAVIACVTGAVLGTINGEIAVLHLVVVWLLCDGISKIVEKKRGEKFSGYYAGGIAIGITVVYLACGWYLANNVWRKPYTVETEKQVGSLRIVQFADSHVGNTFSGEGLARWVEDMQAEKPDIVVITGDFVDDDTSKEDMLAACQALGAFRTTYGVYYVFGNHDKGYYGPAYRGYSGADLIAELEKNNVVVLQDETILLDNRFYLIGRQDRSEEQMGRSRATMEELTKDLEPDKFSIVLDHQPYDYDAQEASGVDLVLSGHTHGGQMIPFNRMGEWLGLDDKIYGMEKRGNTSFIVTSGISDWAIQFKTGCRSEYVVIDVQGAEAALASTPEAERTEGGTGTEKTGAEAGRTREESEADKAGTEAEVGKTEAESGSETINYEAVLQGGTRFFYVSEGMAEPQDINAVPSLFDPEDEYMKIWSFTALDLDGDGSKEIVLSVYGAAGDRGGSLILHQEDGRVYGYPVGYRELEALKEDGTAGYSDPTGVMEGGICAITGFTETGIETDKITYGQGTGEGWDTFVVNHQSATEEEFQAAMDEQAGKSDVVWYDFTEENIKAIFG